MYDNNNHTSNEKLKKSQLDDRKELNQFIKLYSKRTQDILVPFFGLSDDTKDTKNRELFVSYISKVHTVFTEAQNKYKNINKVSILEFLSMVFHQNGEQALLILAYYVSYKNPILEQQFRKIYEEEKNCQTNYARLPSTLFLKYEDNIRSKIVGSVLMEMDHKNIQSRIKKAIYTTSHLDFSKLSTLNLEQYKKVKTSKITPLQKQEMAHVFLMDYLYDRYFLASFSPYVQVMEEKNSSSFVQNTSLEEIMFDFIQEIKEGNQQIVDPIQKMEEPKENLDDLKEQYQILLNQKEKLEKEKKQLENEHLKKINNHRTTIQQQYEKEIQHFQDDNKLKEQKIKDIQSQKEELTKLRNVIWKQEKNEVNETISTEITQTVVFVGGHENLIKNLKEIYPHFIYIQADKPIQEAQIKKGDLVVFFYKHMNHNVYESIMPIIQKEKIPFGYVSSTNLQRLKQEIIQVIQDTL